MRILAQHSPGGVDGPEDIVAVDLDRPDQVEIVARHAPGTTLQFPLVDPIDRFTGRDLVGWYRLPTGGNVNLTPEKGVLVVDGVGDVVLPATARWTDGVVFGCRWGAAGHATFTPEGTLLHAARQDGAFLGLGFWQVSTWGTLETDLTGRPLRSWDRGKSEPAYTGRSLAWCEADGVHAGTRTFAPVAGRPFDPVISPDGTRCCWIENTGILPVRWSVVVGDVATGARRVILPARDWWMTTNTRWLDDSTLIAGQFDPNASVKHWALVTIDTTTGQTTRLTAPEHGSFLCPVRLP